MRIGSLFLASALVVIAGCGSASPSASPQSTPAPSGTPVAASPSAVPSDVPTAEPSTDASAEPGSSLITIPVQALKSLAEGPTVFFGSRVFTITPVQAGDSSTITMADFGNAGVTALATTDTGHALAGLVATADSLVWVETWRDHPSPPSGAVPGCEDTGKPLRWRIVRLVIASKVQSVVASGTTLRTAFEGECADVNPPVIAADGDRVAYTEEAASKAHPFANRVVVRSISEGTQIRAFTTNGIVQDLHLLGAVIAYRDDLAVPPVVAFADPFDGQLMVTSTDAAPPVAVAEHISAAALGDGRIAWISAAATDGSAWTESLTSGVKTQLQVSDASDFHPDGASRIAVSKTTVTWIVQGSGSDSVGTSRLGLWTPGGIGPGLVDGIAQPEFVALSAGWLVWDSSTDAPGGEPSGLFGLPESALVP